MILDRAHSVLIVEDERIVAKDLQQTLADLGYDAFAIASSSDEAIARASERCPDVVLMDIRIKGQRDGIETAAILKRQFDVPVMYLTAHADEATIRRAKATEPHGYLLKPLNSAELRSAIEVCLYKHEMEKRLRERERWFSTALQSIGEAVVTVDIAGKITFMNAAAVALTGMAAEDTIGRFVRDILWSTERQVPAPSESPIATAMREKRAAGHQEASLLNVSTGERRWINDSAVPVIDEGQTIGGVMVFRDVTEQRALQKQLEFSDRLASLGTMAAGVAHEVNNPLAVVVANSAFVAEQLALYRAQIEAGGALLTGDPRLERMSQALSDLESAASRICRIVSDLRAFSRPSEQAIGLVNVAHCIDWAIRTTSHQFQHRARLNVKYGDVPAVRADEGRLGQVFINLLVNAAHAIVPGKATTNEVTITTRTDENGWVEVEVRDTGSGIEPEILARIFEPFFTTKAPGEGTGLGLSICHGIVTSLGGVLRADSEMGGGTRFVVRLPPALQEKGESAAPADKRAGLLKGRVLVVDDEEMVRRTVGRILRDHDFLAAESAREALALLERGERFDVILTDLMMPTMTGMEFYEELLAHYPDVARRVVFLSGGAVSMNMEDFLRSVPNRRVDKPFEIASLLDIVQECLEAHPESRKPSALSQNGMPGVLENHDVATDPHGPHVG